MDQEDRGTEKVKGEKHPEVPVKVHSESHCCISAPGRELCARRGYPKSRRRKKNIKNVP